MKNFEISTDSTCDFLYEEYDMFGIYHISLPMTKELNGKIVEFADDFRSLDEYNQFYNGLRHGDVVKTSMINQQVYVEYFTNLAKNNITNILHFTISYALSPTMDVINSACEIVKQNYPNFNCICVESHSASMGQGLLVRIAQDFQNKGKSLEETAKFINQRKNNVQVFIGVDDLMYLRRGGRVGSAKAIMGTMINLKPILIFNKEGKLEIYKKEIGMKKVIKSMAEEFGKFKLDSTYKDIIIVHTGNMALASNLGQSLKEKFNVDSEIRILGPVIGAHVGPDAVAYLFLSENERPQ